MKHSIRKLADYVRFVASIERRLDEIKIGQGAILASLNRAKSDAKLSEYEFKVFSQWGEDGILQHLTSAIDIENRTFIEFGVEDFYESNCRFLLMHSGWQGFVIDGSQKNIDRLQRSYFFWRYPLKARCGFVTAENVNSLLEESGFDKKLGILSVDVDGVDWHILKELPTWQAAIVIVEYNAVYGAKFAVTVPYEAGFVRRRAHWSNLYYGASLAAFVALLKERGYALVGVNSAGSNAFFVRRELLGGRIREQDLSCFRSGSFREGRDRFGKLMFKSAVELATNFSDLPLIDVTTDRRITVGDVLD